MDYNINNKIIFFYECDGVSKILKNEEVNWLKWKGGRTERLNCQARVIVTNHIW